MARDVSSSLSLARVDGKNVRTRQVPSTDDGDHGRASYDTYFVLCPSTSQVPFRFQTGGYALGANQPCGCGSTCDSVPRRSCGESRRVSAKPAFPAQPRVSRNSWPMSGRRDPRPSETVAKVRPAVPNQRNSDAECRHYFWPCPAAQEGRGQRGGKS